MYACASDDGICMFEFADRRALQTEFKEIRKYLKANIVSGENEHIKELKIQAAEYFEGTRIEFSIDLDTPGTEFQKKVWNILLQIPYGKTITYKEQATSMKIPDSVRAVANANGKNRVSIIIPCHRVIGDNGNLTGYGGGLARKRWLIDHESKNKRLF